MARTIDFKLYFITDRKQMRTTTMEKAVEEALAGGLQAVQIREKDLGTRELLTMAHSLRALTARFNARLFINDRADIAVAVDADGVQLGHTSMPAHAVRTVVGEQMLIGVSTHSPEEVFMAERDGADFVTLGPIYETPSKIKYGKPLGVDSIRTGKNRVTIPVFAIGGITPDRVNEVMGCGADGVAVISAILASDDIAAHTKEFMRVLN
ncbi:MAG: thiamine phosphate synthase [Nitrospiraceae bacterium]|nr:MAG: thiamine phosphate synthase [Nitrospiraceae bacterium]